MLTQPPPIAAALPQEPKTLMTAVVLSMTTVRLGQRQSPIKLLHRPRQDGI
jgi:hypothetical protein